MSPPAVSDALPEWTAILDQISESLAVSLQAADDRQRRGDEMELIPTPFPSISLQEIDNKLHGFDERMEGIRTLAHQIESTLEQDEAAVMDFRRSAREARKRPAPAARLS